MDQRTHAWIALRAIALLEDENELPALVELLKPYVKSAAIGAWLPDKIAAKKGRGDTDNHIFKMKPLPSNDPQAGRFIADQNTLAKRLGSSRQLGRYLKNEAPLSPAWWGQAYKADAPPGHHIPNCVMGLRLTTADLLVTGDPAVQALTKRPAKWLDDLDEEVCTHKQQAALYAMMVSHFIADASMPCHCDARKLSGYANGLHHELETHWSEQVDSLFDDAQLKATSQPPQDILAAARAVDSQFGIQFEPTVPKIKSGRDSWLEMVDVCRGSFALACVIASPDQFGYSSAKSLPFAQVFGDANGKTLLKKVDQIAMHDAVLNVAMVWKDTWLDFTSRGSG